MLDKKPIKRSLPISVLLFSYITLIVTILAMFSPPWEPLYIFVSSLQLFGILGFSIYTFNKLVIKNQIEWWKRIIAFSPVSTLLFIIGAQFGMLISGPNKQQTGSQRLYRSVWNPNISKYSWLGFQYFLFQAFLLIQSWYLYKYVFGNDKGNYMIKFFLLSFISSFTLALIWTGLFPFHAQG